MLMHKTNYFSFAILNCPKKNFKEMGFRQPGVKFIYSLVHYRMRKLPIIATITLNHLATSHNKLSACLINFMERLHYVLI